MTLPRVPNSTDLIKPMLEQLFDGHGIKAECRDNVVVFPDHPGMWVTCETFDTGLMLASGARIWQLDFHLGIGPKRVLVESVSGIGHNEIERINNGLTTFVECSFHVLLSAFFDLSLPDDVERQEWEIAGQRRPVFISAVYWRFGLPKTAEGKLDLRFFAEFERLLKAQPLSPDTHWVRLYQTRYQGEGSNEVLLDNEPWNALQDGMAAFDWPRNEKPYDVRVFLVIRNSG